MDPQKIYGSFSAKTTGDSLTLYGYRYKFTSKCILLSVFLLGRHDPFTVSWSLTSHFKAKCPYSRAAGHSGHWRRNSNTGKLYRLWKTVTERVENIKWPLYNKDFGKWTLYTKPPRSRPLFTPSTNSTCRKRGRKGPNDERRTLALNMHGSLYCLLGA